MIDQNKACAFTGYQDFNEDAMVEHLSEIIKIKTIANRDESLIDYAPYGVLRDYLEKTYPLVHQNCERVIIAKASMLYCWPGNGKSGKKPMLLMAHQDVVPVTPGTEGDWKYPAFDGVVADGHVWGRGAIDMKNMLCAEFEAMEYLMQKGFVPDRDIYLALGHDEECGGTGAMAVAKYMADQGIELDFVMDEGGEPAHGEEHGASDVLVASIALFEKGYCDIHMIANSAGGHSSQPKPGEPSALAKVAKAILAVEANPLPTSLPIAFEKFYRALGPHLDDPQMRAICTDLPNRRDELIAILEKTPQGNATVRTTTAVTQAWGSPAPNILPQKATASVNFRLNPRDTIESLMEHVRNAIGDDSIQLIPFEAREASKVSPTDSPAFALIEETIHEFYPEMVVAPGGVFGGTDSRKFEDICPNIYKFSPFFDTSVYGSTMHATNERISIVDLVRGARFLIRLLEKAAS